MNFSELTHSQLLEALIAELDSEGAKDPWSIVSNYLTSGYLKELFFFEKRTVIQFDGDSGVKNEVASRNREELKGAFATLHSAHQLKDKLMTLYKVLKYEVADPKQQLMEFISSGGNPDYLNPYTGYNRALKWDIIEFAKENIEILRITVLGMVFEE